MKAGSVQPPAGPLGVEAVTAYLDRRGLHYELVTHKPTFRAVDDAAASGVPPHHELKTLVLRGAEDLVLAALGASERLDLHKARELLEDPQLRLASEEEIERAFPRFDIGAVPPVGPGLPRLALLDRRVPKYSRMVCAGGDHSHSLVLIPVELVNAARPQVADICED